MKLIAISSVAVHPRPARYEKIRANQAEYRNKRRAA